MPARLFLLFVLLLAACATPPLPTSTSLPDRVHYLQTDPRWASDRLGRTPGDTIGSDGCLVTAVAMAMTNLGYRIDPGRLNHELTRADAFTPRGYLVWQGVADVSDDAIRAHYHDTVSASLIRQCIAAAQYPLVRFILPSGRSHWAMILSEAPLSNGRTGYHMRDPLRDFDKPLLFPRDASAFKALRCVGRSEAVRA